MKLIIVIGVLSIFFLLSLSGLLFEYGKIKGICGDRADE